MSFQRLASIFGLLILATACIGPSRSSDTPAPNIQDTVQAQVQATIQAAPTATPLPTPALTPTPIPVPTPTPTLPPTNVPEVAPREVISLSISLFLLVDDEEEPDPTISTHRAEEDLREILQGMNEIWSQADIRLELKTIESVEVPEAILQGMLTGDLAPFFNEIGDGITLPQFSTINGFYIRSVGGPNGINPFRSRTFFVIDEPSVFDRRVSSHEVGHILGLHHVMDDPNRLLFSGTNGMTLTEDEATVARYFAQGIIQ